MPKYSHEVKTCLQHHFLVYLRTDTHTRRQTDTLKTIPVLAINNRGAVCLWRWRSRRHCMDLCEWFANWWNVAVRQPINAQSLAVWHVRRLLAAFRRGPYTTGLGSFREIDRPRRWRRQRLKTWRDAGDDYVTTTNLERRDIKTHRGIYNQRASPIDKPTIKSTQRAQTSANAKISTESDPGFESRFLPCDAMHSAAIAVTRCLSVCPSVCPSVRPSRSWVAPKRIKVSSNFFHHVVAKPF